MKCEDVQRLFSVYVDNQLDPKESKLVKEHLSDCRTCQEEWREFNRAVQITRSLPEIEPPSDLFQRVKEGVSPFSKTKRLLTRIARPLSFRVPAWGLAAVVLLVALYLVRIIPSPQERIKVMTGGIPSSSTENEGARVTAGKKRTPGKAPSLDVIPHKEELPGKEREEPMRTAGEPEEGDRLAPGQPPRAPLPKADDRDGVLSFRSVSRMKQTNMSIAGPVMAREIVNMIEPDYASWAKERGLTGTVEVMCVVLPSGEVATTVTWLTSEWSELDQSVVQAIGEWRFEPIPGEELQAGIVRIAFDFSEE